MKSLYFIVIISFLSIACQPEQAEVPEFSINAKISNADSSYAYLILRQNGNDEILDSAQISNDTFSFKGAVDNPVMYYIKIGDNRGNRFKVFVENTNINIDGNLDSIDNIKVEAGEIQAIYQKYQSSLEVFSKRTEQLYKEYNEADSLEDMAKMTYLDSVYDEIMEEKTDIIKNYVYENSKNIFGPYLVMNSELSYSLELPEFEELFDAMDSSLAKTLYYKDLEDKIALLKTIQVGAQMPSFSQEDSSGNMISSDQFRGKYLLIDFWASWCGPCRKENPNVVAMYSDLKDQGVGFEILGVSFDKSRDNWLLAIQEDQLSWPHVSDLNGWSNAVGDLYGISSIPHTVLVDPEGIIIAHKLRGDELKEKLESLLSES